MANVQYLSDLEMLIEADMVDRGFNPYDASSRALYWELMLDAD